MDNDPERKEQEEKQKDKDIKIVKEIAEVLTTQFDSVQIFATRYNKNNGETTNVCWGQGDYYARFGLVGAWHKRQEHYEATANTDET